MPERVRSTLILVAFVLTDPQPDLPDDEFGETRLERDLTTRVTEFLQSHGPQLEVVSSASVNLPTSASGRCAHCGVWTTDRRRAEEAGAYARLLVPGSVHGGDLRCDLCLPEDHPPRF